MNTIKAVLNNEVTVLNEITQAQVEKIAQENITEHNGKKYYNPSGAVIFPDITKKPSDYHKWSGSGWIVDTAKKQELIKLLETRIDKHTDETIFNGFVYDGNNYYLSIENQINFKGLNDIRETLTYPVKIKHQNGYAMIASSADYHQFYLAGLGFKQLTIENGWNEKDNLQTKTIEELITLLEV